MTAESDFKESMVHAEALAAAMRDAGLRAARAWGRQGAGARVYLADQYVTVSRGGDVSGHYIAPGTRARLTFDQSALYPAERKAFAAALKAYREERAAYLDARAAALEAATAAEAERDGYRMRHRPDPDGLHAHNLRSPEAPDRLLDRPEWYTGFPGLVMLVRAQLLRVQGKPDETLAIFRAVPANVREIRSGDWVTLSPRYAQGHLEQMAGGQGGHVIEAVVPARTVRFAGDDLMEWGYWGPTVVGRVVGKR